MSKQLNLDANETVAKFLQELHRQINAVRKLSQRLHGVVENGNCRKIELMLSIALGKTYRVSEYIKKEAKEIAQQIDEELMVTFSSAVHDINNMVSVMVGYSEMALEICREGDYLEIKRDLESIIKSTSVAIQTIEKAEPGSQDLTELLEAVLSFNSAKDIQVITDFPKNKRIYVKGTSSDLMRIFDNLIRNAKYAVRKKTSYLPDQDRALGVFVNSNGKMVSVDFVDNGIGISNLQCEQIFNPWFTTKGDEGQGMGLHCCREIINKLGGDITVQSSLGRGTTFRLEIPIITGRCHEKKSRRNKLSDREL